MLFRPESGGRGNSWFSVVGCCLQRNWIDGDDVVTAMLGKKCWAVLNEPAVGGTCRVRANAAIQAGTYERFLDALESVGGQDA